MNTTFVSSGSPRYRRQFSNMQVVRPRCRYPANTTVITITAPLSSSGTGSLPSGGLANQVLTKLSGDNYDCNWEYIYLDAGIIE